MVDLILTDVEIDTVVSLRANNFIDDEVSTETLKKFKKDEIIETLINVASNQNEDVNDLFEDMDEDFGNQKEETSYHGDDNEVQDADFSESNEDFDESFEDNYDGDKDELDDLDDIDKL